MPTEPLERLMRLVEQEAKKEYGGIPSPIIEALCQRLGLELRAVCQREGIDVNRTYTVEMTAVSLGLRLACEVLLRERKIAPGDRQWFTGFGNKSQWSTQTHKNGSYRRK